MAARRHRRGRRRNRGRFGFLYKLLSFLLIFAAILVGCIVFFRVDTVEIIGQTRYTTEEIIAAAGVKQGDNLITLNKVTLGDRIVRDLPYIDTVIPSRKLPDTLIIEVTPTIAMAALEHGGECWLLDARCKLLERGDAALAEGWAVVLGLTPLAPDEGTIMVVTEEEEHKLESLSALLSALQARGMESSLTEFIDVSAAGEIRFGYEGTLTVVVPMNADFTQKSYALSRTLEAMTEREIPWEGTLDLTYGNDEARLLPERWLPASQKQDGEPETDAAPPVPAESTPPEESGTP